MTQLARRQVGTLLLFAAGDAGLKPLEQHFGSEAVDLREFPGAVVSIAPGLDHDLTGSAMRREAADRMIDFLQQIAPMRDPLAFQNRKMPTVAVGDALPDLHPVLFS
jgi:hypothetical protein